MAFSASARVSSETLLAKASFTKTSSSRERKGLMPLYLSGKELPALSPPPAFPRPVGCNLLSSVFILLVHYAVIGLFKQFKGRWFADVIIQRFFGRTHVSVLSFKHFDEIVGTEQPVDVCLPAAFKSTRQEIRFSGLLQHPAYGSIVKFLHPGPDMLFSLARKRHGPRQIPADFVVEIHHIALLHS